MKTKNLAVLAMTACFISGCATTGPTILPVETPAEHERITLEALSNQSDMDARQADSDAIRYPVRAEYYHGVSDQAKRQGVILREEAARGEFPIPITVPSIPPG